MGTCECASNTSIMDFERTYFSPGSEPTAYTSNICNLKGGKHEDCPGILKYDPQLMEPPP